MYRHTAMTSKGIPILLFALAGAVFASCSREDTVASRANENQDWAILTKTDLPKFVSGHRFDEKCYCASGVDRL
jgi:hypothetical protein